MRDEKLCGLAEEVECSARIDEDLASRIEAALRAGGFPYAATFDTTDAVLSLIAEVKPGWSIDTEGTASRDYGHWTATLRSSRERDNDAVLGVAHAQHLPQALLAALIRVLAQGDG